MKVTNEQLGAVYLDVDGLDKERFKELIKGMKSHPNYSDRLLNTEYEYLENWCSSIHGYTWFPTDDIDRRSKKITLDELEQLLNPTPQPTHFDISPDDYAEFMKWKCHKSEEKKKIEIHGCLMEDCQDVNFDTPGRVVDYVDYELITRNYGIYDVFSAIGVMDNDRTILFGHWNDGVTE